MARSRSGVYRLHSQGLVRGALAVCTAEVGDLERLHLAGLVDLDDLSVPKQEVKSFYTCMNNKQQPFGSSTCNECAPEASRCGREWARIGRRWTAWGAGCVSFVLGSVSSFLSDTYPGVLTIMMY
jgi:hypothetical protein